MKKLLLPAILLTSMLGYSQTFDNIPTGSGYYINKLIVEPVGPDVTNELIEIRGTPNEVIPSDLWLLAVEGDSNTGNFGRVSEELQLGDGIRTFGANGIFAIVCNYIDINGTTIETIDDDEGESGDLLDDSNDGEDDVLFTNPYADLMPDETSVLTITLEGRLQTSGLSAAITGRDIDIGYDGNFSDASASYMLISSGIDPDGVYLDGPNAGDGLDFDGVIDTKGKHTLWTLYDSVAFLDDDHTTKEDGGIERGYAQIVFAQDYNINSANQSGTTSSNIIDYTFGTVEGPHQILMRQGTSTGYEATDWVIGDAIGTIPDFEFTGFAQPVEYAYWYKINTVYGDLNPVLDNTLSTDDFSINGLSLSAYPIPLTDTLSVDGIDDIDSTTIYSMTGGIVAKGLQSLDVSSLASGMYILEVKSNEKTTNTIIVK